MSQPVTQRVLVIDNDIRVRAAMAALIDATAGLQVVATIGACDDALAVGSLVGATVAVVDIDAGHTDGDVAAIHELAEHVTVVAVGNAAADGPRALQAGAVAFCDKNGDPDALTAAVEAAARCKPTRARPTGDTGRSGPPPAPPNPTTP